LGLAEQSDLAFGRTVHQCVFPGGRLLAAIRAGERFWRIINRVPAPEEPQLPVVIAGPAELNYQSITAVGHGRGEPAAGPGRRGHAMPSRRHQEVFWSARVRTAEP
jgi:hypothetical protein